MSFIKPQPDYETFCNDVEITARIVDVPCNTAVVRSIFRTYWEYCRSGWLAFRTTTKSRDLSVRYIDVTIPHNPYTIALEQGFLTQEGHPIENLISDLQARYPILGFGVDVGASHGIEKIWPFVCSAIQVDELYDLPSMPPAMKAYSSYFKKYDLKWTSLYAIDYWHKSMNIYFMFPEPGHFSPEKVANMIKDLGFTVPSQEELEVNSKVGALYYTFTWDSPRCERINFAVPHAPESSFPMQWSPLFARLMRETPTLRDEIRGSIQTAYTPNNHNYLKVEVDYSGMEYSMVAAIEALPH